MAIKRVFTCRGCDIEYPEKFIIKTNYRYVSCSSNCVVWYGVCESCFEDGVLDDININGDTAGVNTSEGY